MNTAALSSLRFFAVLIVVLFHNIWSSTFLKTIPKIFTAGPQMVSFFFVLSGFVLVLAYQTPEKIPLREYYLKRTARILPVYYIALVFSIVLMIIFSEAINPTAVVLNALLLQSWFLSYPLSINGPGWFLSDLMFFYVLFPFLLKYLKYFQLRPGNVLILSLFLWFATQVLLTILLNTSFYDGSLPQSHALIFYFPLSHLCSFVLGLSGAYFLVTREEPIKLSATLSCIVIVFLSCLLVLLIENQVNIRESLGIKLPFYSSFYSPLFLLIIVSFSVSRNFITSALSFKPLLILGEISFSLYILQKPVRIFMQSVLEPMNLNYDTFLVIYILMLIAVGIFMVHVVDKPIRKYVKKQLC